MKEAQLQKQVAQYLNILEKKGGFIWWHTPNDVRTNIGKAMKLKADGVKAGIPDILILASGKIYGIELKRPKTDIQGKGYLSLAQKELHPKMAEQGCEVKIAYSVEEVKKCLNDWNIK